MNVLILGPDRTGLAGFIGNQGDDVRRTEEPVGPTYEPILWADFVVSFGYRHIIDAATIEKIRGRAINLHISLLPWNRGADPNVWSFLEDTPKGVTIHLLDEGVDTGAILLQQRLEIGPPHTLRTSYDLLIAAIDALFRENWRDLREHRIVAQPQGPGGTVHRAADLDAFKHVLTDRWDTPVERLVGIAVDSRDGEAS